MVSLLRAKIPLQCLYLYTIKPSSMYVSIRVSSPLIFYCWNDEHHCRDCVPGTRTPDPYAFVQHLCWFHVDGEVFIFNHLHHCLCFSNLGNANLTKEILVFINILLRCIYCDWRKRIFDMQRICRWKNIKLFSAIRISWMSKFVVEKHSDSA